MIYYLQVGTFHDFNLESSEFFSQVSGIRKVLIESLNAAAVRWSHVGLGGV